jgi:hypothetical protein
MSLFEDASLIVTPNAVKAGKLYSIKPTDGSGDLSVVRATSATRANANGLIETVGANIPRLDYSNGSCPSILVEPQRTNLVFPSATATTQSRTVTAVAHTLSFYGTGSVVLSGVAIATLNGTGENDRVTLTFTPTAGTLILTIVGSVINWQLEAGSNATSYIPTVASAVTRNADVISKTGISDLIGQTEGTLFAEFSTKNILSTNKRILGLKSSNNQNRIALRIINNGNLGVEVFSNNLSIYNNNANVSLISNTFFKILVTYTNTKIKMFVNGLLVLETGVVNFSPNEIISTLTLGISEVNFVTEIIDGSIKEAVVFKTALSDQECINLTTL